MTERRRFPNKRASQNFSFERADKYSCIVKQFDGCGSADVRVRDAASHLQHRVNIPRDNNTEARTRRKPADDHPTPVGNPRRLVKLWRVDAKVGKVRPPNGDAAQCSREPSSGTARSTLTSSATKAFICTFSTRANPVRRA